MLNNTSLWHSHSRGISMEVARRKLNLRIDDIGEDGEDTIAEMRDALMAYNNLLFDHRVRRSHEDFGIDSKAGYFGN